ncbi:MAG: serine acetyltransferase [Ferruginibacter sp.]|nr:serine acetyltransferase [Cytophagales bacterium]
MNHAERFFTELQQYNQSACRAMPSKLHAQRFTDDLINFLFPVFIGQDFSLAQAGVNWQHLQRQFRELLLPLKHQLPAAAEELTEAFFEGIPAIYQSLLKDAEAILRFDPAANSLEEIIVAYPGFYSITVYRLSHRLHTLRIPILPRLVSEYAHGRTGIDIHPGARIGESFFIDHGTGVVIGETCVIGNCVKIYQGVTLGALSVEKALAHTKRHPTLEDNVIIYAGSTVLGGQTTIGHNTVIGGNVWLTESVPPYSVVYHKSEVRVRDASPHPEPIDFSI